MPIVGNRSRVHALALDPRVIFIAGDCRDHVQALANSLTQDRTVELHLPEGQDRFYLNSRLRPCQEVAGAILARTRCLAFVIGDLSGSLAHAMEDFARFSPRLVYAYSRNGTGTLSHASSPSADSTPPDFPLLLKRHAPRVHVVSVEDLQLNAGVFEMLCDRLGTQPVNNLLESSSSFAADSVPVRHPLDEYRLAPSAPRLPRKIDLGPWELRVAPSAKAHLSAGDSGVCARVEFGQQPEGDKPGAVSLVSQEIEIERGENYTIECTMDVSSPRPLGLGVRGSAPSGSDDFYRPILLRSGENTYLRSFQASESRRARVVLEVGHSPIPIVVLSTSIHVAAKRLPLPLGRNDTTVEIIDAPDGPDSLRFDVQGCSAEKGDAQIMFSVPTIVKGQRYRLHFEARADQFKTIGFGVSRMVDPWLGLGIYFDVGVERFWKPYYYEFVANADCDKPRILFDVGLAPVAVEIRNLKLEPVSVEVTHADADLLREIGRPSRKRFGLFSVWEKLTRVQ